MLGWLACSERSARLVLAMAESEKDHGGKCMDAAGEICAMHTVATPAARRRAVVHESEGAARIGFACDLVRLADRVICPPVCRRKKL